MRVTEPLLRDGGELRPVSWERALEEAAAAPAARRRADGRARRRRRDQRGGLAARAADARGAGLAAPRLARRPARWRSSCARELAEPALQAKVSDLEFAHAVLVLDCEPIDDAPILDLRLRKGVRRHGMKLERDARATTSTRCATTARQLARQGEELVILWGERLAAGARRRRARAGAARPRGRAVARRDRRSAGLLEIPATSNGRGLREAGVLPNAGPGLRAAEPHGRDAPAIAGALAGGELSALYLLEVDPLSAGDPFAERRRAPTQRRATRRPLAVAGGAGAREHGRRARDVPDRGHRTSTRTWSSRPRSYAEKEGTVMHPDGRLQRLRPAVAQRRRRRARAGR